MFLNPISLLTLQADTYKLQTQQIFTFVHNTFVLTIINIPNVNFLLRMRLIKHAFQRTVILVAYLATIQNNQRQQYFRHLVVTGWALYTAWCYCDHLQRYYCFSHSTSTNGSDEAMRICEPGVTARQNLRSTLHYPKKGVIWWCPTLFPAQIRLS
ncbi:Hypothetical_protein [Hexamita inflata]|uniref:Hypothetical_protein n=1 Tax=Hexamita inflata TaxID=28002 RepID=A0ABP1I739_9EUKA